MLNQQLVEDIARRLRPGGEGVIEKDWHVVRAISVLATLDHGDVRPVFSGGTSLSIAWGLIRLGSDIMGQKCRSADWLGIQRCD